MTRRNIHGIIGLMPKINQRALITSVFVTVTILVSQISVNAFDSQSNSYKVQMGNFDFTAGSKSSTNYQVTDTAGELGPGQSDSTGYTVKAGFQYVNSIIPFTFTISNNAINFGTLTPQTPKTDTTDLTVTSGAAFGYKVTAIESSPLKHTAYPTRTIINVLGDNSDITSTNQGAWALNTTYGFGYTLSNITGTDAVFTSNYRNFSDTSSGGQPINLMQKNGVTATSVVRVTYKVNISSTQSAGNYQNTITYVATGTF